MHNPTHDPEVDILLPSSIAIPVTAEHAEVLETVRLSIVVTYKDVSVTRHMVWPTEAFHRIADQRRGLMPLFREAVLTCLYSSADELFPTEPPPNVPGRGPVVQYAGRWWMAPIGFDPKAIFHPSTPDAIYRLASVNFIGYLPIW